jgi:2-polyprenyl-6-methoxyphenol hydroxylase-like FAD-dependent oxidoreductase
VEARLSKTACVLGAVKYSCRVQNVNVIGAGGIGVALGGALARAGWNVTMVDIIRHSRIRHVRLFEAVRSVSSISLAALTISR